jgi:tetratricopeptide (TPR) repeat protein
VVLGAAQTLARTGPDRHVQTALSIYEALTARSPGMAEAHLGMASLLYEQGRAEQAIASYRKVLEIEPDHFQALNNLAWTLAEAHPHEPLLLAQALELATRAVELAPKDPNARDTRAYILSRMPDRLTEARKEYQACIDLSPPDSRMRAQAVFSLLQICRSLKDDEGVRRCADEARRIERANPDAVTDAQRAELSQLVSDPQP